MFRLCGLVAVVMGGLLPWSAHGQSPPTFEKDVLPILNAHCLQCHGGVHQRRDLDLRTLERLIAGGKSGSPIVAGNAAESLLWRRVESDEMPRTDNKVSAANKKVIRAWIESGARGVGKKAEWKVPGEARSPAEVARRIDAEIERKRSGTQIPVSPRSEDAEFLRRVFLDLTGKPPKAARTVAFFTENAPDKREKLIEELLASEDFAAHFAERWVSLFRQMSVGSREWEPEPFLAWFADGFKKDRGWDATVREMFSAAGVWSENPQTAYFYYNTDMMGKFEPKILVGNLAQVFLGTQLQCAECHDHPFADYTQADFWGLAAFFASTSAKNNPPESRGIYDNFSKTPKSDKTVAITIPKGEARNAGTQIPAKLLADGHPKLDPGVSPRPALAQWLTAKSNQQFALAATNRFWAHFFGRGFVHPLTDFGDHNEASHPELLRELALEFAASGWNVKHLVRCIVLSEAYQRTSRAVPGNETGDAEPLFVRMTAKVLPPEDLYDALCIALEVPEIVAPTKTAPKVAPAVAVTPPKVVPPPPTPRALFVKFFRSPGEIDEPTELKLGVPHVLKLMNEKNFNTGGALVERVMANSKSPEEVVDGLFLAVLARHALPAEQQRFAAFVASQPSERQAYDRVVWVLVNSTAFVLNH